MESQSYNQQSIDIGQETMAVLKTVLLLEKDYPGTYIQRILTGNSLFGWKKDHHKQMETFGELSELPYSHVDDLVNYLVKQGFLKITQQTYGLIALTEDGQKWLDAPQPLVTTKGELRKSWYQVQLIRALRELRKEAAAQKEKRPFDLFTNYTMEVLVDKLPQTEEALKAIPGAEKMDGSIRLMVLAEISRIVEKKELDDETGVFRKAYSPSHQKVKELFLGGTKVEDIATKRDLSASSVTTYLENLHRAGEIDLRPWIEENVGNKVLHKVIQYFRQVSSGGLKQAHEVLGVEYDVLKLCRLYMDTSTVPMKQVS
ncbi:MAG: RQC domain-containing protein [Bacteroidia bacterium]|nr:RQC domain-containing protein [Bacteroidia bacterium]